MIVIALMALAAQAARGQTFVDPKALPRPGSGRNVLAVPRILRRPEGFAPTAPPGFRVHLWATGLQSPRWLLVGPNGDVFVTEGYQGRIVLLRDRNRTGISDWRTVFARGLNLPFGMAIRGGYFYVANTNSVVRFPYAAGDTSVKGPETIVKGIPSRGYRQHWTRNILFEPGGERFFLTIGSETNKSPEPLPRAAIWRYRADGSGRELIATGLRNPVGLARHPDTGDLWATCVERDYQGDDLVPDFLTRVVPGQFYGWPWFYIGRNRDPSVPARGAPKGPVTVPDLLFTAHSTPLGLMFYAGNMFPAEYRGDAFVAMRGSTNRRVRSGYEVVRVRFRDGRPVRGYESFVEGWIPDRRQRQVYGRPVGLAELPDGSMLIADEAGHCIWRVKYADPSRD